MTEAYIFCKKVRSTILLHAGEGIAYGTINPDEKGWSKEFVATNLIEVRELVHFRTGFDPNELTQEEAKDLGFGKWSEESNLYLIPIYLAKFIRSGSKLIDINDETFEFGADGTDLDHRYGLLSFGVVFKTESNNG